MDPQLLACPLLTFSELTAEELLAELKQELQQGFDRCSEKLAEDIKNLLVQSTPLPLTKGPSVPPLASLLVQPTPLPLASSCISRESTCGSIFVSPRASPENQPTTLVDIDGLPRKQSEEVTSRELTRELTEELSRTSLKELDVDMEQVWAEPKTDEVDLHTERPIRGSLATLAHKMPAEEASHVEAVEGFEGMSDSSAVEIAVDDDYVEALQPTKHVRCVVAPEEKKPDIIAETNVRLAVIPEEKQPITMPDSAHDRNSYDYRRDIYQHLSTVRRWSFRSAVTGFFLSSENGDKGRKSFSHATKKGHWLPYRCAVSHPFNFMCMALIVANAIWLGYDVDHQLGDRTADWHVWVSMSFTIWFIFELTFKLIGLQQYFVTGPDWKWNLFDMVLVLLSIPELFSSSMNVSLLRIMRLTKLTKTLRIVRVLKFAKSLREIVMTVLLTFGTLFWCFVAIILVAYSSAIMLLEALSMSFDEGVKFSDSTMYTFRSVWSTMMALFGMITGGTDWYLYAIDFEAYGAYFPQYLLAIWIYFMMFGFLNIVLAVFCAQGTEATLADAELRLEAETQKRRAKMTELVKLFGMIDTEDLGIITWKQFHSFGAGPEGQSYLQSQGLELFGLQGVWRLMDKYDGSQDDVVDLASFIMAFNRLSGENLGTELVMLSEKLTALGQELRDAFHELRNHSQEGS